MFEIILFQGEARVGVANTGGYPVNEKHAFLLFLKQAKNTPPDFEKAKQAMERADWREVNLSRAGIITLELALSSIHKYAEASYKDALATGAATVTFAEPIP